MITISFASDFSSVPMDLVHPPEGGYQFELEGDVCTPSDAEIEYILEHTLGLLMKLKRKSTASSLKGEIRVKAADRRIVRSVHYTWHVKRADGLPLSPMELPFAFAMQGFSRLEEKCQPVISLPLSMLKTLLEAGKEVGDAIVIALAGADRESGELSINDREIATSLEQLGLVAATTRPGRYLLLAINVT